jgi:hypothetical protein
MVVIPSAIFGNTQKFNKSVVAPPLSSFQSKANEVLGQKKGAYL